MQTKNYPEDIDIHKYWLVLKRRWLIASGVFVGTVALAGVAISLQRPNYEASGRLLFQANRTTSLTGVGEKVGELESVRHEANPLDTQAVIIQSIPVLQEVIAKLQLKDQHGSLLKPEMLALKVEPLLGTDVLKVTHTSVNPELSAQIVNQVMNSYIAKNIQNNRSDTVQAGKFVEAQLPNARNDLNQAAEALRQFKSKYQVIELKQQSDKAVEVLADLDTELNTARSQLASITAQEAATRQQANLPNQAVEVAALSQNRGVQSILDELQKVQTQLAAQTSLYTASYPSVVSLREQEAKLNALLRSQVAQSTNGNVPVVPARLQMGQMKQQFTNDLVQLQSQRLGLTRKIAALTSLQADYRRKSNIIPSLDKKQGELERNLSVAQKTYETLLTRLQELKIAENQTVGNAQIVQSAIVPRAAIRSKATMYLGVGGVAAGILLGIAAAFFIDIIDRSLKTVKEAEELFGYTLLGLIPKFDISNSPQPMLEGVSPRVIVTTTPRSMLHETYQMLQANLKFISLDKKVKSIAVTSSVPREGKSEVAANLAAVMAQTGRRVLLVDADMRRPTQHHLWGKLNLVGFSNVVVGQNDFEEAVTKITDNLSVLTAGVMPPNPLALIDSERMTALIEMFSRRYDYVVFDTPPLVGMADAAVLGKMVDGVLVVARPGVADTKSAQAAKSLLARSEANILGIVANGVNIKQDSDNFFYYTDPRSEADVAAAARR